MIKLLERKGLAFGADTNASTGFDETVYKLVADQSQDDNTFSVSGNINVTWPAGVTPHFDPSWSWERPRC